ncbi:hypothetical protein, partial [Klebsiella pneumoniae]|uniref:hypothetical protein n=1 Tax=Klebsiella pneumoniae TaxID=573 RepID=UPI00273065B7
EGKAEGADVVIVTVDVVGVIVMVVAMMIVVSVLVAMAVVMVRMMGMRLFLGEGFLVEPARDVRHLLAGLEETRIEQLGSSDLPDLRLQLA